jgi:hypothetical protein
MIATGPAGVIDDEQRAVVGVAHQVRGGEVAVDRPWSRPGA